MSFTVTKALFGVIPRTSTDFLEPYTKSEDITASIQNLLQEKTIKVVSSEKKFGTDLKNILTSTNIKPTANDFVRLQISIADKASGLFYHIYVMTSGWRVYKGKDLIEYSKALDSPLFIMPKSILVCSAVDCESI